MSTLEPSSAGELQAPSQDIQKSPSEVRQSISVRSSPAVASYLGEIRPAARVGFEYGEHALIGNYIDLFSRDGTKYKAITQPFSLPNGLSLTYGQIGALAGDFYATGHPISDGSTVEKRIERFKKAYATLAEDTSLQPAEATALLALLEPEVAAIDKAAAKGQDGSPIYATLPNIDAELEWATIDRSGPGYMGISLINWDHFGEHARLAYGAGHAHALEVAKSGDLETAYIINAFANHFLQDSFSSGHVRTPRKELHNGVMVSLLGDGCAKLMHDEECAIGINVKNRRGDHWLMYGDKRLLDKVNDANRKICTEAVQASANEIYAAWNPDAPKPNPPPPSVDDLLPDIQAAMKGQELAPLFIVESDGVVARRVDLFDRKLAKYTEDWWADDTLWDAYYGPNKKWWEYPITINGPSA